MCKYLFVCLDNEKCSSRYFMFSVNYLFDFKLNRLKLKLNFMSDKLSIFIWLPMNFVRSFMSPALY